MKTKLILGTALILMFCGIFIVSCEKDPVVNNPTGFTDTDPVGPDRQLPYSNTDWMANIDDSRYLSELTIPGTHDAGADYHTSEQGVESQFTIAQDFCLLNQLMLGVRWFDVRLNDDGGIMTVYHWDYYLHKNFTDLVNWALTFLDNHQREVVIFMIKQEHSTRGDDAFANGVMGYLNWAHPGRFWMGDYVPQLGEVRGQVVIVRQFTGTHGYALGTRLMWNENTTGSYASTDLPVYAYVQDHYSLMTVPTETKINEIENCLNMANHEPCKYRCYYLNFTSGTREADAGQSLKHISSEINPVINNYLWNDNSHYYGTVFVNFAGGSDDGQVSPDLVQTLVNKNIFDNSLNIGSQVWMNHNLRVTKYRNGDPIPQVTDPTVWNNLTTGAWCYYNNDASHSWADGILYNWYAVNDTRGLAPTGWHVASDAEWTTLINFLGGTGVAGGNLKDVGIAHWLTPNTGATNTVLFTATPAGYREPNGTFGGNLLQENWWTSTQYNSGNAYDLYIQYNDAAIHNENAVKNYGLSVRCIKD